VLSCHLPSVVAQHFVTVLWLIKYKKKKKKKPLSNEKLHFVQKGRVPDISFKWHLFEQKFA
jgi:hypothetical protein